MPKIMVLGPVVLELHQNFTLLTLQTKVKDIYDLAGVRQLISTYRHMSNTTFLNGAIFEHISVKFLSLKVKGHRQCGYSSTHLSLLLTCKRLPKMAFISKAVMKQLQKT